MEPYLGFCLFVYFGVGFGGFWFFFADLAVLDKNHCAYK